MGPVPCEKLLGRTINTIQEVMSGRAPSQTGYMTACPDHVLWQVCSVHLYIVTCIAAEHNHVPGWAGPGWTGAWREFGGSSERDNRTNGPSRCNAGWAGNTVPHP